MATKNGLCTHCQFNRIENHVFPVNPEASVAYCPFCMQPLDPKEAIGLYQSIINGMIEKADNTLFVACDPVVAYQEYADVLDIEPNNSKALLGRILCLIYTSRVRQAYLTECDELLDQITHKGQEEVATYTMFLKKINFALDEYDLALLNKLTHRKYFYDEECIKLYLKRLSDIIKFKKEILANLNQIKKDYVTQNNEILINLVAHSISEKEGQLKTVKYTVRGLGYKYQKIAGDKVYLDGVDEVVNTKVAKKYSTFSLDTKRKSRLIEDRVFKDYTPVIKAKKISIYFSIFLLLAAIGCGGAAYYFYSQTNLLLFFILIGVGAAALIGSIVLLVLHFVWNGILKKRKLRMN